MGQKQIKSALISVFYKEGLDRVVKKLNDLGVGKLFPPGTDTKEIVEYITNYVKEHRNF